MNTQMFARVVSTKMCENEKGARFFAETGPKNCVYFAGASTFKQEVGEEFIVSFYWCK